MYLSALQKYILLECYLSQQRKYLKKELLKYYNCPSVYTKDSEGKKKKVKKEDRPSIITKSIERLIKKELLIGYGERTAHKWYIKEIKLTFLGRKTAKKLLDKQQKLPFKKYRKNN